MVNPIKSRYYPVAAARRIGSDILQRQQVQGWGTKVIERLANDLKQAFPDMRGWSSSNLKYMRFFAQLCPDLPCQAVKLGWSRSTLEINIKNQLMQRQGVAVTNFAARLPEVLVKSLPSIEEIEAEFVAGLIE